MRIRFDCFGEECESDSRFPGMRETAGSAARRPAAEVTGDADCEAQPLGAIIEQLLDAYSRCFPQMSVQIVETPAGCAP